MTETKDTGPVAFMQQMVSLDFASVTSPVHKRFDKQMREGRIVGQKNVASTAIAKTAVTAGALAATAYARVLGQKMIKAGDVPVDGATDPSAQTPPDVAGAQRKLSVLQWAIPALTGALLVMDALMGEQQRPSQAASGFVQRLLPDSLAA